MRLLQHPCILLSLAAVMVEDHGGLPFGPSNTIIRSGYAPITGSNESSPLIALEMALEASL